MGGPSIAEIGAGITGLGALFSGIGSSKDKGGENAWLQNPEYPEAAAARENWWSKLQSWGDDLYYGAIQPDWGTIWNNAQNKVRQYFWGSATQPGVSDKIKASVSRRNMTGGPALEQNLAAMSATEGGIYGDMASEEAQKKADLANRGRETWLSSIQNLSNTKPSGQWTTTPVEQSGWSVAGDTLSKTGGAGMSYGISNMSNQMPNISQSGITSSGGMSNSDWTKYLKDTDTPYQHLSIGGY